MGYNKKKPGNCCCIKCKKELYRIDSHIIQCPNACENVDYVMCFLCNKKFLSIGNHLKITHRTETKTYLKKFPQAIITSDFSKKYYGRSTLKKTENNKRNKLKKQDKLEELKILNERTSKSVSRSIMGNQSERQRRAKLLGELNKTQAFRDKASATAIKTSSRPEILKQRTEQLNRLREVSSSMFWQSKPEKELFSLCKEIDPSFKKSQSLKRETWSNSSKRHQIDIFSKEKQTIIEYDGTGHFVPIYGSSSYEKSKITDYEINNLAFLENYKVIRISQDQFKYRGICGFTTSSIEALKNILTLKHGLYLIGDFYGESNFLHTNRNASNLRSGSRSY